MSEPESVVSLGALASGQGPSNVFPSIGLGAAAQREILEAWTQATIFGRAPLDGEGALPVKLEHASAQEGGARYNAVDLGSNLGSVARLLRKIASAMCGTRCRRFSDREEDLSMKMQFVGHGMNNATSQGMWVDV